MFTMMNNARLSVGVQGVAIAERATQGALAFARERRQGRAHGAAETSAIIEHPDVLRMLLTMTAYTAAARAICFETAAAIDRARRHGDAEAEQRASLLTPVAKAFSSDIGNEVASLGVQAFGGMGFIEETGAAQLMRDVRIAAIYEGTNGIQAIDLVTRKLKLSGGAVLAREIEDMRAIVKEAQLPQDDRFVAVCQHAGNVVEAFAFVSEHMLALVETEPRASLAGASDYLRLFALARGATLLLKSARWADRLGDASAVRRIALARFFAEHQALAAFGLSSSILNGAGSVTAAGLAPA